MMLGRRHVRMLLPFVPVQTDHQVGREGSIERTLEYMVKFMLRACRLTQSKHKTQRMYNYPRS